MRTELEARPARTPIVRRAFAGIVLIAAAALAIHIVFNLILTVFWIVVAVAVVLAVVWAVNTLA